MHATATTTPARPRGPSRSGDVLVIDVDGIPDWARAWCRASGRTLQRMTIPAPDEDNPIALAERLRAIGDLADTTAQAGGAVLVTRPRPAPAGRRLRVVAALRRLPDDAAVLAYAAETAAHLGGGVLAAHAVPWSFGERSVGMQAALDRGRRLLATASSSACPGVTIEPRLLRVHPHELVGEQLDADLLVIGGPRPHGGLGLVARSALHHAPCPVLLVPRH